MCTVSTGACSFTESSADYWTSQVGTFDANGLPLTLKPSTTSTRFEACASLGVGGSHFLTGIYALAYTGTGTLAFEGDAQYIAGLSSAGRAVFNVSRPGKRALN